jgi:formamidopyrimidine-DNA glycosylase
MPELPEVEITARLLDEALRGARVASAVAAGVGTLKSYDPALSELSGLEVTGVSRRGKILLIEFGDLVMLIHLMSAGRLQLFDGAGSVRDRTRRLALRLEGERELRLREFGTKHAAWAKLVRAKNLDQDDVLATMGPEAYPPPADLSERLNEARPLHNSLRDQRVVAGIGRSWVDEILHRARLSPFKRGDSLTADEAEVLREAIEACLGSAIRHYLRKVSIPIPDKFPMPLAVHGRQGKPCPRCGTKLEAVHYEDHTMTYCPECQTGGKILKDRRLSRLLK